MLLCLEILERFFGVGANAENDNIFFIKFWLEIAKFAGLDGAAGSAGFGVEIEENALAFEMGERDLPAFV